MRCVPRCAGWALCLSLALGATLPLSAQRYSLAGTFQASVAEYPATLRVPDYRSYGVMVGVERLGHWWSPHLWLQRYDLLNICQDPTPGDARCNGDGWSLSVGPSIEFLNTGPVRGSFLPQLGLDSRGNQDLTGGAGFHFGWDAGFIQPQAFGRFQTLRGWNYVTMGVGLRVDLSAGETSARRERGPFRDRQ